MPMDPIRLYACHIGRYGTREYNNRAIHSNSITFFNHDQKCFQSIMELLHKRKFGKLYLFFPK